MSVPKSRRGGAYIMVLTVTMLLFTLVSVVLSVTTVSRRVTSYYHDHIGLYDLAIAGNEQALLLLRQYFDSSRRAAVSEQAWAQIKSEAHAGIGFVVENGRLRLDTTTYERFKQFFAKEAMRSVITPALDDIFDYEEVRRTPSIPFGKVHRLTWSLDAAIDIGERIVTDSYRAYTDLRPAVNQVYIHTNVRKYIGDVLSHWAIVEATLNWEAYGYRVILINAHTILELELAGVIFPIRPMPGGGLLLILDDFTLTMVESMRVERLRIERWGTPIAET